MIYAVPLLGLMTGCRTMMPMALLCWYLYTGHLDVSGSWAFWSAKLVTAIVFSVLAAGELIGDKLPQTPNRTSLGPAIARFLFGGLIGSIIATGLHSGHFVGELLGSVFAVAGTFFGYHLRRWLVTSIKMPDLGVAIAEDALVIGISIAALRLLPA